MTILCPHCRDSIGERWRLEYPLNAETVEYPCPDCQDKGHPETLRYLDKTGAVIRPKNIQLLPQEGR